MQGIQSILNSAAAAVSMMLATLAAAQMPELVPAPPSRQALTAQLQFAIEPAAASERANQIAALRRLQDERLRPLFAQLVESESAALRKEGFLGVAELDGGMDPLLLARIDSPVEQLWLLELALEEGLVTERALREILTWANRPPGVEAMAMGRLARITGEINEDRLLELASCDQVGVRVLVNLLAEQYLSHPLSEAGADEIFTRPEPERFRHLKLFLAYIEREHLTVATSFVDRIAQTYADDLELRNGAIRTMLSIMPQHGVAMLEDALQGSTELAERLLLAQAVMQSHSQTPATAFRALASADHPLLNAIARAGAALSNDDPAAGDALVELIAHGHWQSSLWAVEETHRLDDTAAVQVLRTALGLPRRVMYFDAGFNRAQHAAARELARRFPSQFSQLLRTAATQRAEAFLHLLLTSALSIEGRVPEDVDLREIDWRGRQSRAMANLLQARQTAEPESESESESDQLPAKARAAELAHIAAGRANLPPQMRIQAAWLSLCLNDEHRLALTSLLAPRPVNQAAAADESR